MVSTLLELAGLAALITGVLILLGIGWALIVACPCLLLAGLAADGWKPSRPR